jgi:hypothetical protein
MYFQFKCNNGDKAKFNQLIGLHMSWIAVLVSTMYIFVILYLRKTSKLNMKLWDFNTVTSGDFTVQIDLNL